MASEEKKNGDGSFLFAKKPNAEEKGFLASARVLVSRLRQLRPRPCSVRTSFDVIARVAEVLQSTICLEFRHIMEHAAVALKYFLEIRSETALRSLLHWIYAAIKLFLPNKCGWLLTMDRESALLLPPVYSPYQTSVTRQETKVLLPLRAEAYHVGCFSDDAKLNLIAVS
ncbi:hypothetical protein DITRI_Ditri12bG0126100 [Diplodiscus trichospermus]